MADFREDIKGIIKEYPSESGRTKIVVRVVSWVKDGQAYRPKLEFRQMYIKKTVDENNNPVEKWVNGKCVGIGSDIVNDLLNSDILTKAIDLLS